MTNRLLSGRVIGFFFILIAMAGCVDYKEPTGPVPVPEPGDGEFTSVIGEADGTASAAGRRGSRAP